MGEQSSTLISWHMIQLPYIALLSSCMVFAHCMCSLRGLAEAHRDAAHAGARDTCTMRQTTACFCQMGSSIRVCQRRSPHTR